MNIRSLFTRKVEDKTPQAVWQSDAQVRLFAFHPDVPKRELMAADMKEFLRGMDAYNEGCAANKKVRLEVRKELADFLQTFIEGKAPRSMWGGLSSAQGFRLHVGKAVYEADYFNDQVFNTGLRVYREGEKQKVGEFLCGLSRPMDFGAFAEKLLPQSRIGGLFGRKPG